MTWRGRFQSIEEVFSPLAKKASKKKPTMSDGNLTAKALLNPMNIASCMCIIPYHIH